MLLLLPEFCKHRGRESGRETEEEEEGGRVTEEEGGRVGERQRKREAEWERDRGRGRERIRKEWRSSSVM